MGAGVTVLGIDPGSRCLGWGVVREESGVLRLMDCGTIKAKSKDFSERIGEIYCALSAIVASHAPDEAGIENVFTHKNMLSALKLGQARGAAIAACAAHNVPVFDYEPTLIKKSLVGTGKAEKSQVSFMVARILGVQTEWEADTSDALGCAICHLNSRKLKMLLAARSR